MLVHKKTLGVLLEYFTGDYVPASIVNSNKDGEFNAIREIPKYKYIKLTDLPESERDEYWEIKNNTLLARRILQCYPDFTPILDEKGQLVNIAVENDSRKEKAQIEQEKKEYFKSRGSSTVRRGVRIDSQFGVLYDEIRSRTGDTSEDKPDLNVEDLIKYFKS